MTFWVALDDATIANGCMEVILGSHKLGLLSTFGSVVHDDEVKRHCRDELRVPLEVPAGHGVLLHNWILHRSGINKTPVPRRAFTACFVDARTTNLQTGTFFPTVDGLQPETPRFLEVMNATDAHQRASLLEAEQYVEHLRASFDEAETYALDLERALAERDLEAEQLRAQLNNSTSRRRWWQR
jgi:ectoine hydroxylase-related dioxygenase (phytanoyl-CoA dioxygenase family)